MRQKIRMDKAEIEVVLYLYQAGLTKNSLGRLFHKDHSTIIHHIKRWHVHQIKCKAVTFKAVPKVEMECKPVKTYADYIREDMERARRRKSQMIRMLGACRAIEGCRMIDSPTINLSND